MNLSIIIPVYNGAASLPDLMRRLAATLSARSEPFEVILINDGSRDNSWDVIRDLSAQYDCLHGINLMRNYGQHNALLCGIRAARGRFIVTMDDDLQHPPEEIPRLLVALSEDLDVVYGTPLQEQHGLWRDLASQITKLSLQHAMGAATARQVSAFRAFRAQLAQAFVDYHSPFVSIDVLLTWATTRFTSVTVRHDPRRHGVSNYTFRKLVAHALNMLTGFSTWPLQIASMIGFTFTLLGLGLLAFVLGRYLLEGSTVAGFPFLASMIAIFAGAQLFALGVIGEYLARMHFRMMERPTYTVRDRVGGSER